MGKQKYLGLWEIDQSRIPVDPVERGNLFLLMLSMVKQDMESGKTKEFGGFVGENNGFFFAEGSEVEISIMLQQYVPYVSFKVYPAMKFDQVEEYAKALAGK
jgi:hypothetical protein